MKNNYVEIITQDKFMLNHKSFINFTLNENELFEYLFIDPFDNNEINSSIKIKNKKCPNNSSLEYTYIEFIITSTYEKDINDIKIYSDNDDYFYIENSYVGDSNLYYYKIDGEENLYKFITYLILSNYEIFKDINNIKKKYKNDMDNIKKKIDDFLILK